MRKVLTLNKAMIPVEFKEPREAFKLLCKGNADIFDVNYNFFTLDAWLEDKDCIRELGDFDGNMNTVKFEIPIPPVIVLKYFERVHPITIHPTPENIWKREGGRCAYCGEEMHVKDVTLDHVHPKCRGGTKEWMNIVASCFKCNQKKADRDLNSIEDMSLIHEPFIPSKTSILYTQSADAIEAFPEFWKHFFVEFK